MYTFPELISGFEPRELDCRAHILNHDITGQSSRIAFLVDFSLSYTSFHIKF